MPATTARNCGQGLVRLAPTSHSGPAMRSVTAGRSCAGHPLGVEHAQPERDEHAGDDPEPDHDRDLAPAGELEVVLQGRHPEQPTAAGGLEPADLQRDRERDEREQAPQQQQEHLGPGAIWQLWLYCQTPISVYAPNTMTQAPVASPSSPSVRFTPFEAPVTMINAQITNTMDPSSNDVSRKIDNASEAGVLAC